jgi:succinate-semialdehyde dehydrogenase/glutarate-semialdehyde dehydrogenase
MAIYEPIEGAGPRRRYQLRSPVTLEPIGELECMTREDVAVAVERARKAQPAWADTPIEARAAVLRRAQALVLEHEDRIMDSVVRETGKTATEAFSMEVFSSCASLGYYAKRAKKFLAPEKRRIAGVMGLAKQLRLVYKPLGVVGIIVPWNGPFVLAMNQSAQALVAGNAVLLKGSEVTPESTALVGEILAEAGLPDGVLQVLRGDGETGAALVEAGLDKVSFTGSVATGRKVAEACGRQLIPVTLELGGKDAMIVCADADLDRAAAGALIGSCMNTGHYCCGTERIYAVDSVYEPFLEKVVEGARRLRQTDAGECDVGAVFWDRQLDIIEAHVRDAVEKGASVLVGGRRNPDLRGLYFEPTVVTDVTHDMDLMTHETFGPVISVMRVSDEEEAIRLANDSEYGLNGNVWTRDKEKGFRIAERIETGGVCINRREEQRRRAGQRRPRPARLLPRASDDRRPARRKAPGRLSVLARGPRGHEEVLALPLWHPTRPPPVVVFGAQHPPPGWCRVLSDAEETGRGRGRGGASRSVFAQSASSAFPPCVPPGCLPLRVRSVRVFSVPALRAPALSESALRA